MLWTKDNLSTHQQHSKRTMATWTLIYGCLVLVLMTLFHRSDAVQCYTCTYVANRYDSENCFSPSTTTATCTGGHCSYLYTVDASVLILVRACETGPSDNQCGYVTVSGNQYYACICNTYLCNYGRTNSGGGGNPTTSMTLPTTIAAPTICYSCTYAYSSSGNGNCMYPDGTTSWCRGGYCSTLTTTTSNGYTTIVRSCQSGTLGTSYRCYQVTVNGQPSTACYCSYDRCNSVSGSSGTGSSGTGSSGTGSNGNNDSGSSGSSGSGSGGSSGGGSAVGSGIRRCYDCTYYVSGTQVDTQNCKNPGGSTPTCTGDYCSMIHSTAGDVVRTCQTGTSTNRCYTASVNEMSVQACVCNANYCNTDALTKSGSVVPMVLLEVILTTACVPILLAIF